MKFHSSFALFTFQALKSHIWLVAAKLDCADIRMSRTFPTSQKVLSESAQLENEEVLNQAKRRGRKCQADRAPNGRRHLSENKDLTDNQCACQMLHREAEEDEGRQKQVRQSRTYTFQIARTKKKIKQTQSIQWKTM